MSGTAKDPYGLFFQNFGFDALKPQGKFGDLAMGTGAMGTGPIEAGTPMAIASKWLTYWNTQTAENMRVAKALSQCTNPTEAANLWAGYVTNSQRHLAEAAAAMMAPMAGAAPSATPTAGTSASPSATAPEAQPETKAKPAAAPAKPQAEKADTDKAAAKPAAEATPARDTGAETPPARLDAPRQGSADDLKQISGIGPLLEKKLNGLGLFHFDQLAELTPDNIRWIDGQLRFRGRVERERWVEQAKMLAAGNQPAHANGAVEHAGASE